MPLPLHSDPPTSTTTSTPFHVPTSASVSLIHPPNTTFTYSTKPSLPPPPPPPTSQQQQHSHIPLQLNHSLPPAPLSHISHPLSKPAPTTNTATTTTTSTHPHSLPFLHHPQQPPTSAPHHIPAHHPPLQPPSSTAHHISPTQPLQPILPPHHPHPTLLPGLSQPPFKPTEEVDVADDLINLANLPQPRPDINNLVSNAFTQDHLQHPQVQSVMDAFLPEHEQDHDPLTVSIHLPLHLDPHQNPHHRSFDPEPRPPNQPSLSAQNILNPPSQQSYLQVPASMSLAAHLSYPTPSPPAQSPIPHPQVLLHANSTVSPFAMQPRQAVDASTNQPPTQLIMSRPPVRPGPAPHHPVSHPMPAGSQHPLIHISGPDDAQRRAIGGNQISIQDLTKPKVDNLDPASHDPSYSPASPAFSAVTITPPAMVPHAQPGASGGTVTGGESPTSIATPQGLSCPICKSVFTRRYNLKVHMSSKHSARRDYHCQDCSNAFNRVDSLKRHVATTHRGEKKWMCTYCQRTFGQRPHMKMHVDTVHLKKRDHKCHCGKAFGTRYNLTAHQRTHQQTPKKHVCAVCKKSFALKSSLARHQRNSSHNNADMAAVPTRMQN